MNPKKPIKGSPKTPPRTKVNRSRLMALIRRYRKLLQKELKYLEGQDGDTVSLRVQRNSAVSLAGAPEAESSGGNGGEMQVLSVRKRDPGELDNCCIVYPGSTESDTDLIDTVTPYARALTESL